MSPDDVDVSRRVNRGYSRKYSMTGNSDKDAGEKRGILSTERKQKMDDAKDASDDEEA